MAFEQLDKHTDNLKAEYLRTGKAEYLYALTDFYETVCQHAKFKQQKAYCRKAIFDANRAYAVGYFKSEN